MKTYFYDCYDEKFVPITQIFCKDTIELLEKAPNVRYLFCMDFMVGRCFKRVSKDGVGYIVRDSFWENFKMTDIEIEKLWDELEDVPIDENECIDIDWRNWSKGTHREEIWHWFDENHSKGVGWLMNERETKY